MKCTLCKYKNAALEAQKHTNGVTVFAAEALKNKLREERGRVCEAHVAQDAYSTDLEIATKALASAKEYGYIPMESIWNKQVWVPKGERQ